MVDLCVGGGPPSAGLAIVAYCSHVLGMAALGLAIEFALDNLHKLGQLRLELSQLWLALFGSGRHRGLHVVGSVCPIQSKGLICQSLLGN